MFDNHWQPYAWKPPGKWAIRWRIVGPRLFDGRSEGWVHRIVWKGKTLAQNADEKQPITLYDSLEAALADVLIWMEEQNDGNKQDSFFDIVNMATNESIPSDILV